MTWGPGAAGGFQNALQTGVQLGSMVRQNRERNALLQQQDRRIGLQERKFEQEQQQEQETARLTQLAIAGNEAALDQLASINLERWKTITTEQKAQVLREEKVFGETALDILQLPFEQRRDRIVGYAQQMPEYAEQINALAFLPQAEQEAALRAVVANAQLVNRLHTMERPRYQAIPEGGTLVDTSSPQAVRQFQGEQGGYTEGQTATNPETGQRIVFRNGAWRPM